MGRSMCIVRDDMDREAFSIMGRIREANHRTLAIAAIALGKIVELGCRRSAEL